MKKILLGTSAIIAMAAMGASAHVRDGLVDSSPTRFELTIAGEVSSYVGYTSVSAEDADGNELFDEDYFGQDYSADIDFIAKTHVRDWEIEARVELDYNSNNSFDADEIYMDFTKANIGTFRLGRGPAPSDMISLEAALPGENWDDVGAINNSFGLGGVFGGLDNSRFADDANQIGYYSPKFGDMFQFGIAYIFETEDNLDNDALANSTDDDAVEVAAKFEKEFSGFNFGVSGAYRYFFDQDEVEDFAEKSDQWTVGLVLGYMGFNWTTTYGETSYVDVDAYDWGVRTAVTYAWDRWEAGVAYETGAQYQSSDETTKTSLVEAGLSFHVFDGMDVHGALAYAWSDHDENAATAADWSADAFQVRTGIDLSW
ncbi:MAG: porin [Alphaproteobacteria bacterium]